MDRNYLKGETGDRINAMLAATASNFKNWMRNTIQQLIFVLNFIKQIWNIWQIKQLPNQSKADAVLFVC